jgi:small subunit ribosomal protein S6e
MVKLTINDIKAKKSYKKELDSNPLLTKKIGEIVSGDSFGFKGYEFRVTGGSDKQGFPMRADLPGIGRKKILIVSGVGIKKKEKGMRQRKSIHGNTIDDNIAQINLKVEKYGKDTLPKILGLEEKKEEEKPAEESKSEEKTEDSKEEKKE